MRVMHLRWRLRVRVGLKIGCHLSGHAEEPAEERQLDGYQSFIPLDSLLQLLSHYLSVYTVP
jgi:hypothetical protein